MKNTKKKNQTYIGNWLKLKLFGPTELADVCHSFKLQDVKLKECQSVCKLIKKSEKKSLKIIKKCKDSTALKRLEKYENEYIAILRKLEETTKSLSDFESAIQIEIPSVSKIIEGYIRAIANCNNKKRRRLYYKMIHLKTDFLFRIGFYSPNDDSRSFDASVCSIISICETTDKNLEGKIADYYAIPFVSFEGKVVSYGRVSVYKTI